jgi:hypothetical protein
MHHRMRAVDALELVVVPVGTLRPLVLAVADLDRRAMQRLRRAHRVEDELDHLPVAFVEVVPVVEDVEEPVLKGELARMSRVRRDVRVDGRGPTGDEPSFPSEVVTARVERVPRKVEVVLEKAFREILGRRADLDQVVAPRPAQGDCRLAEEQADVDRGVRLPGRAVGVFDEPYDRGVALCQRLLIGQARGCNRCRGPRDRRERDDEGAAGQHPVGCSQPSALDMRRSIPSSRERKRATSRPLTLFPANEVIKTEGDSDLYVQQNTWDPAACGGCVPTTGWHTHPGPSLVIVTQGTATEYDGDDPTCTPHVYSANGTNAFIDPGDGHVHIIRDESGAVANHPSVDRRDTCVVP